jgi:hypothetical protein
MDDNDKTMKLKPTDAYEYMKGKGYDKSLIRFRQLIQDGAFPNMKTIKRGRRLLHAIPVSDLDNFDAEAFNQKVGRRPDPEAKYHNWREKYGKKQGEETKE